MQEQVETLEGNMGFSTLIVKFLLIVFNTNIKMGSPALKTTAESLIDISDTSVEIQNVMWKSSLF